MTLLQLRAVPGRATARRRAMNEQEPVRRDALEISTKPATPYGPVGAKIAAFFREFRPEWTASLEAEGTFDQTVAQAEATFSDRHEEVIEELMRSGLTRAAADLQATERLMAEMAEESERTPDE